MTQRANKDIGDVFITVSGKGGDGYTVVANEDGITVSGNSLRGAFYGIQTLRQIIRTADSPEVVEFEIADEPDFADRGFYHDVTRGRVPKLDTLKSLADTLAYFKINSLQLYIEDAFDFVELDGIMSEDDVLTAEEIVELDEYCHERFIELVPSVSCFGHLYNLLQSEKYSHLCELENHKPSRHYWIEKMRHHTIDASNPESIELVTSLIDQFAGLCRTDKFNICCDETFDICKGRNAGKDAGEEYFRFVNQIIKYLKSRGKTVMMWGDIAIHHHEKIGLLPEDTIMLNWDYKAAPTESKIKTVEKSGLPQYVCPGTSTWNRFIEWIDCSYQNITLMAKYGYESGAVGFLNTNWGDYGNICSLVGARYGLVLGAERGWNACGGELGEDFERAFTALIYSGELSECDNIVPIIREISRCENTGVKWNNMVDWYSANYIEDRETALAADGDKLRESIEKCDAIVARLEKIKIYDDEDICELIVAARGIQLLDRIAMCIIEKDSERVYADAWLREYREQWLRTSKESQLWRIEEFVNTLCMIAQEKL